MIKKCNILSLLCSKYGSRWFVAGCCVAFVVLALLDKWLNPVLSSDGAFYLQLVEVWLRAGGYQAVLEEVGTRAEIVPAFLLFLIKNIAECGLSPESAGVGISMVTGMTLPLLVYLMTQEIQNDKRVSLAAALLITFNPSMIELAREVQRDMLYIVLCGWSIFFALKGLLRKTLWSWIPAGILGACAMLTRYETFEMLLILLFAFLLFGIKKELTWKKIGQQFAVFVVAGVMTVFILINVMGVQKYIFSSYSKYFNSKWILLERKVADGEGI